MFHAGPEVSPEEALKRRDLTINAIAEAPYGPSPIVRRADLEGRLSEPSERGSGVAEPRPATPVSLLRRR